LGSDIAIYIVKIGEMMTCIVAVADDGNVWMGSDSAAVRGLGLAVRRDPKIYRVGEFLFGFTSSFRMGQLLGYQFVPPEHPVDCDSDRYMATAFVDALRDTLKSGGYARSENGEESAGEFLVAYRGKIYQVCSDYQVGENLEPFNAVGCGAELALGALYATKGMHPEERIIIALEASEAFSAGVSAPFLVETLKR
jgi:ATP-dependent protease HslVU (ClpYQ) peptidase subunit